jgi:hypothetical protein
VISVGELGVGRGRVCARGPVRPSVVLHFRQGMAGGVRAQ